MAAHDGGYGTGQMPLAGVVLCCTSIPPEQRTALAHIGAQMGATIKLDLTSDVTHLIVGNIDSAKYRYVAKSREDVKVLAPIWLEALRTVWMEGEDVNVAELEKEHKLPTFYGLNICLTGFDDPDQRKHIQETVVANGAEYHGDLTKSVTHLIAANPTGKKYEHAVNWRTKIVTWEWFVESTKRGMALDESFFHPTMAPEDRGKGAWDRRQSPSNHLGKRARETDEQPINPLKRKLRRSASSRMGSQSEALWAGITAAGFEKKTDGDDWTDPADVPGLPRTNSPALQAGNVDVAAPEEDTPLDPAPAAQHVQVPRSVEGIFEGRPVLTAAFDAQKTTILRDHLAGNGASVLRRSEELQALSASERYRGYLVVPHDVAIDLTSLPGGAGDMSLVTNWWVEQCLHKKSLVDPSESVLCQPFNKHSISGFNGLIINSTGFTGIELLQVTKVVTLMGASYDEYLTTKTSVIVCNTPTPNAAKVKFARNNRIQVVDAQWLWDSIRTGESQPFEEFALSSSNEAGRDQPRKKTGPFTEVPTAPLSEEDSAKLRDSKAQSKAQSSRQAAKTSRNAPHGVRALQLSKSAEPTPASTTDSSTLTPDYDEDDDALSAPLDGSNSLPLQDINPSVNSPRRPSTSSNTSNAKSTSSKSNPDSSLRPPPAPRITKQPTPELGTPLLETETAPAPAIEDTRPDYSSIMSELLAHRKTSTSKPDDNSKRKPRRQLGRATSTRSNPSTADDPISRASSVVAEDKDRGWEATRPTRKEGTGLDEYEPSQELGWDAPGAQEAREQMIRAMGGKVEDSAGVVRSIGVVKDVVAGEVIEGGLRERNVRSGRRKRA